MENYENKLRLIFNERMFTLQLYSQTIEGTNVKDTSRDGQHYHN